METVSGKQREIQLRDELFLQVAQELLLQEGYHTLTMGRIASVARFSKGTLYNRFTCKEELVVELACRCCERRWDLIARSIAFQGRPRERMVAIGEGAEHFARLYPDDLRVMHIIDAEAILEKVSDEQRARMKAADRQVFDIMVEIVNEAVACGDLKLPPRSNSSEICFALWALVDGGATAVLGGLPLKQFGVNDSFGAIARGCHILMDGCNWRPLSHECNYSDVARRICDTLLTEESKQVSATESIGRLLSKPL